MLLLLVAGVLFAAGSPNFTRSYSSDVGLYEHYARAALASPVFHALPREYPALALGVFVVPLAVPLTYSLGFALLAAGAGLVLVLSSDGLPGCPGWSRRTCYYLLMGTVTVVFARYDVFPALAAVLAVEGARKGNWGRGLDLGCGRWDAQIVPVPFVARVPDRRAGANGQVGAPESRGRLRSRNPHHRRPSLPSRRAASFPR